MKNSFYFPHDNNARSDEKITHLLSKSGWAGYGIYWALIEKLHESSDGWLKLDYNTLSYDLRTQSECITPVIQNYDLFIFDGDLFTSHRVLHNIDIRAEKTKSARKGAIKSWENRKSKSGDMHKQCTSNAQAMLGKERKGKEIKEKKERYIISQNDFISELKTNIAYKGINIDKELAKMDAWLLSPKGKGRKKTHTFILNWLNKIDTEVIKPEKPVNTMRTL